MFPGKYWPMMNMDLGQLVVKVRTGEILQGTAENSLCCMLANAAWEASPFKSDHRHWKHPEVQVLRHVRNSASHGNKWHFTEPSNGRNGEPAHIAHWRGFVIDHWPKGSAHPLHGKPCFGADLGSGDLVRLLLDVEALIR
jgi:hypothetical protein